MARSGAAGLACGFRKLEIPRGQVRDARAQVVAQSLADLAEPQQTN
jgi:hypothetical protein